MPISIIITDDHALLRETWCTILNTNQQFNVLATCATGEAALEETKKLRPEIVIMDINLPGINGVEATRQILDQVPGTKVLGYSLHLEPAYVKRMINEGAMGYITKTATVEEMTEALLTIHNNKHYVCREATPTISIYPTNQFFNPYQLNQ